MTCREERERVEIQGLFSDFNQEENAQRHLSDCFDLAFCANALESDQSAARLQALKDSGVTDIPGVLRGASVDSALLRFNRVKCARADRYNQSRSRNILIWVIESHASRNESKKCTYSC